MEYQNLTEPDPPVKAAEELFEDGLKGFEGKVPGERPGKNFPENFRAVAWVAGIMLTSLGVGEMIGYPGGLVAAGVTILLVLVITKEK